MSETLNPKLKLLRFDLPEGSLLARACDFSESGTQKTAATYQEALAQPKDPKYLYIYTVLSRLLNWGYIGDDIGAYYRGYSGGY